MINKLLNWIAWKLLGHTEKDRDVATLEITEVVCNSCSNTFYVDGKSTDYEPNYCCYCGLKVGKRVYE